MEKRQSKFIVKFNNNATGVFWCSQVAIGYNNGLKVRIFGTKGTIEWEQGHPEGYYEAFANTYSIFINALQKKKAGLTLTDDDLDFTSVEAGVNGVKFINKCLESSQRGAVWVNF